MSFPTFKYPQNDTKDIAIKGLPKATITYNSEPFRSKTRNTLLAKAAGFPIIKCNSNTSYS